MHLLASEHALCLWSLSASYLSSPACKGCLSCSKDNGCSRCQQKLFFFLRREGMRQHGECLHACPAGYYGHRAPDMNRCAREHVLLRWGRAGLGPRWAGTTSRWDGRGWRQPKPPGKQEWGRSVSQVHAVCISMLIRCFHSTNALFTKTSQAPHIAKSLPLSGTHLLVSHSHPSPFSCS